MIRSFDDLKAELLANPDVRAEYEARAAEFEIAAESIAARIKAASRMHNPMMLRSGNKI